ncbi:D-erythrulose reductase-like [Mytilus californianus]|uniref:D-erythrulose reductase-like n=1 Tax=Mytilus californianus TaxID=6549 RepID=UPI0022487589|nr:D-erythrulose reductase-like [Mytilus californianus]
MEIKLDGKKALVTGAGKGIGRAIAKKLVECGAETYALSRTQADLDTLKKEVPSMHVIQIDLQEWDKSRETIAKIGPVDLLVNNAGVSKLAKFTEMKKEDLNYVMDVNFNAVFNVSQVVAKAMVERGEGGSIINISSAASQDALMDHAAYCPSKAAVDMLTKCMALELGPHKIRVNSINPTVTWTDMAKMHWSDPAKSEPMLAKIPLGKFIGVEDVVNSVIFLLSDKSAMTTGECVRIDGGLGVH